MLDGGLVDIIVVVWVALDVILKLREWVALFLETRKDTTDDTPTLLTRGDVTRLRSALSNWPVDRTRETQELLRYLQHIRLKTRAVLKSVDPAALAEIDNAIALQ